MNVEFITGSIRSGLDNINEQISEKMRGIIGQNERYNLMLSRDTLVAIYATARDILTGDPLTLRDQAHVVDQKDTEQLLHCSWSKLEDLPRNTPQAYRHFQRELAVRVFSSRMQAEYQGSEGEPALEQRLFRNEVSLGGTLLSELVFAQQQDMNVDHAISQPWAGDRFVGRVTVAAVS